MKPVAKNSAITIAILAAGSSSRLGHPKQLIPWQGEPMLRLMIHRAQQTTSDNIVVVLGAHAELIIPTLAGESVHVIINPQWTTGIGSSIRQAINFIRQHLKHTQAVILMVCDQPFVSSFHLQQLIDCYLKHGAGIVASAYAGTAGVPALFDKTLFDKLLHLPPDEGAGKIIRSTTGLLTVPFPEGQYDIDTAADLNELRNSGLLT